MNEIAENIGVILIVLLAIGTGYVLLIHPTVNANGSEHQTEKQLRKNLCSDINAELFYISCGYACSYWSCINENGDEWRQEWSKYKQSYILVKGGK